MITCDNGVRIVTNETELPWHLIGAEDVFIDMETKSGHYQKMSTNPYHNCWIAGICLTVDNEKGAWYIPVGHYTGKNIELTAVKKFMTALMKDCKRWINHNIKYDAHVLMNCLGINFEAYEMVCTLTLAKLIDSDRKYKGGYGIDALSKYWLKENIDNVKKAMSPYLVNNKDYGKIPIDLLGEYGGQDVITNRRIWHYIDSRLPDQCRAIWNTEIELTRVLFDMECNGMKVDPTQLKITQLKTIAKMLMIEAEIESIVGRSIRPHVNEDCYQVLCIQYGLPVLSYTEKTEKGGGGNPSFDKAALTNYIIHPGAPVKLVKLMIAYRKLDTFNSLFLNNFLKYEVDGRIHCSYNQSVTTGRLSCKDPNFQQADESAKELILCDDDHVLLDLDYSQIEFRTIVHYIDDKKCIAAYAEDADTDFHSWVKVMVGIHRKPAKTVNFLMAYGGGKDLLVNKLMTIAELVEPLKLHVDGLVAEKKITEDQAKPLLQVLARKRGEQVYDKYHEALPGLKTTSYAAAKAAKTRGYVFTLAGRHRHIPATHAHNAFNSLNQGTAADIQKERSVAVAKYCKPRGIKMLATVHDNTLFSVPKERATFQTRLEISAIMENPRVKLNVPIRASGGYSETTWLVASKSEDKVPVDKVKEEWKKLQEFA